MNDDGKDPGQVFAIPDLWAPSKLLTDAPGLTSFLFSELKLDGLCLPLLEPPAANESVQTSMKDCPTL